jgi:transcriptional regulator with XRE-family HTH domain
MPASGNVVQVIRRVRQRLGQSQEGLARLLNATKGAVQHWERGRNSPDLARLMALRQLCPPGRERTQLDVLIRQTQTRVAPLGMGMLTVNGHGPRITPGATGGSAAFPGDDLKLLRREHNRLRSQVAKLQGTLQKRDEQLRILQDLAAELQRELTALRTKAVG